MKHRIAFLAASRCSLSLGLILAAALNSVNPALASSSEQAAHRHALPTTRLLLPQSDAFAVLGHSCGGIGEQVYATGFELTSGYPTGEVYLSTTCSTGGIGSHPHTYTAWAAVTWDLAGNVVSSMALAGAPMVDPTFTASDDFGDTIYNTGTAAYLRVPLPAAPMSVSAVQSGDLFQVSWIPTLINPAAVVSTTVTATPFGSTAPVLTTTVVGSATSAVVSPLQPQTTYWISVVNTTICGSGPASIPISVTSSGATVPPAAPTGLTAHWTVQEPVGPTDMLVANWLAAYPGDSPIDSYLVRITNHDNGTSYTQTVSGTTLTASFTVDWIPDWSVTVQAHNAFGWGPWSSAYTLGGL